MGERGKVINSTQIGLQLRFVPFQIPQSAITPIMSTYIYSLFLFTETLKSTSVWTRTISSQFWRLLCCQLHHRCIQKECVAYTTHSWTTHELKLVGFLINMHNRISLFRLSRQFLPFPFSNLHWEYLLLHLNRQKWQIKNK